MNKVFLTEQKSKAQNGLSAIGDTSTDVKSKLLIVYHYINSLLEPNKYLDIQKEDLRKLALELGYTEDTEFEKWFSAVR